MTARSASCLDPWDNAMSADEALASIRREVAPIAAVETVALHDAPNRVLAEDLIASAHVPPHRNSAMDGYALRGADLGRGPLQLHLCGEAFAGHPFVGEVPADGCIRIMTGAPMPPALDTVVIQERVTRDGDRVSIPAGEIAGANVRQAGEDIAAGSLVLAAGSRLTPARLGLLASLGIARVPVRRRPRVAFFASGDEIRPLGAALGPGQIFNSNSYTLFGSLKALGVETIDLGLVRDQPEAIEQALRAGAGQADLVLTTGGISVGAADHIGRLIPSLGRIHFHKVAIKPGRPLTFASIDQALFFGLPGNPVAVLTCFQQFVRPALRLLSGEDDAAPLRFPARSLTGLRHKPGRTEYRRGLLSCDADGHPVVDGSGRQGSGILTSMSHGNCFIVLPPDRGAVEPGEWVMVEPFAID
ncbi:gephyrin-like molybdotransferase Glp [uncultured Thiohalocapsa sp.]|uniref:molybdopterin molybdotransferase MoeA n=1 Tax=uncultured Thiohalocapsa sp. TaxID=768990 RepID=UPI0025FD38D0|nr:gephyrin-like molybdotransferase Glp [uncultured Thiohalocapsa sp.]